MKDLSQVKRVRWAVRSVLVLGVVASTVANILHAVDNPISQTIAAWPPVALLLTIELIARIPVHSRILAWVRMGAASILAGIAAWVSYWHMVGVTARYGETGSSPYLLPLSVDGLIVVASICLVELTNKIRSAEAVTQEPAEAPDLDEMLTKYEIVQQDWDHAAEIELAEAFLAEAPVSPAAPRAPRAAWDYRKVAEMAVDGLPTQVIVDATKCGRATVDRFRKVAKALKADPRALIDSASEKLRPEYVTAMRELVLR